MEGLSQTTIHTPHISGPRVVVVVIISVNLQSGVGRQAAMFEPSGMGKLDTNDTSYRPPNTSHLVRRVVHICMYTLPAALFLPG